MSRAEAEKVMRSFARTARERRGELEDGIERAVAAMLGKMHLATTDRMEELAKRLRTLERKSRAKR